MLCAVLLQAAWPGGRARGGWSRRLPVWVSMGDDHHWEGRCRGRCVRVVEWLVTAQCCRGVRWFDSRPAESSRLRGGLDAVEDVEAPALAEGGDVQRAVVAGCGRWSENGVWVNKPALRRLGVGAGCSIHGEQLVGVVQATLHVQRHSRQPTK